MPLFNLTIRPHQWVEIGKILRPHGLRAGMKVQSFSSPPDHLFRYAQHWISPLSQQELYFKESSPVPNLTTNVFELQALRPFYITSWAPLKPPFFIIFAACPTPCNTLERGDVEAFRHHILYAPRSAISHPLCQADWLYRWVYNKTLDLWGAVGDVHDFGAGEVLEIFWQDSPPASLPWVTSPDVFHRQTSKSFINFHNIQDIQDDVLMVALEAGV